MVHRWKLRRIQTTCELLQVMSLMHIMQSCHVGSYIKQVPMNMYVQTKPYDWCPKCISPLYINIWTLTHKVHKQFVCWGKVLGTMWTYVVVVEFREFCRAGTMRVHILWRGYLFIYIHTYIVYIVYTYGLEEKTYNFFIFFLPVCSPFFYAPSESFLAPWSTTLKFVSCLFLFLCLWILPVFYLFFLLVWTCSLLSFFSVFLSVVHMAKKMRMWFFFFKNKKETHWNSIVHIAKGTHEYTYFQGKGYSPTKGHH